MNFVGTVFMIFQLPWLLAAWFVLPVFLGSGLGLLVAKKRGWKL